MTERDGHHGELRTVAGPTSLSPEQILFFRTFGFVCVRGLFADEADRISTGFDEVFASEEPNAMYQSVHFDDLRMTIGPQFVERSSDLSWIKSDPRLVGVLTSLLGPDYADDESDGNIFSCDTGWHSDMFGAKLHERLYVKVYFYLDPLRADCGSLRVIPGTNSLTSSYAKDLRRLLWEVDGPSTAFGIEPQDIPSWGLETEPGDVVFGDYRTLHAAFGGGPRRRLFTMNFSSPLDVVSQL